MLLFDEIQKDESIDKETRARLAQCVVIDASNVGEYYYAGTDKEYWHAKDFPNVAPPFPHFWIDFRAPNETVSEVSGVRKWDYRLPSKWGLEVTARTPEPPPAIHTNAGRKKILADMTEDVYRMFRSVQLSFEIPDITPFAAMDYDEAKKHFPPDKLHLLWQLKDMTDLYKLMAAGKWEQAIDLWNEQTKNIKWIVTYRLSQKIFIDGKDTILPQCWLWKISVAPGGEIAMFKDTDQSLMLSSPLNRMHEMIQDFVTRGVSYVEATTLFKQALGPLLESAMLAISFMHCKNVTLDTVTPGRKIVHNNNARRRGDKDYQPVQFKTLNIKPMRQVLKSEGQEGTKGTAYAMHICRGHFKSYQEGRGLFGKLHGTYWWNDVVRGSSPRTIEKKYNIDLTQLKTHK